MALVYLVPLFLLLCILEDRFSTTSTSPNRLGMGLLCKESGGPNK